MIGEVKNPGLDKLEDFTDNEKYGKFKRKMSKSIVKPAVETLERTTDNVTN